MEKPNNDENISKNTTNDKKENKNENENENERERLKWYFIRSSERN